MIQRRKITRRFFRPFQELQENPAEGQGGGRYRTLDCPVSMLGGGIYFRIKGLQTHNCMSQSGWLLHSICPGGIACLCGGLSGRANVFTLSMRVCVCVCLCSCALINIEARKLKASNQPRRHTVPCVRSPYTVPTIPRSSRHHAEGGGWKDGRTRRGFVPLAGGCLQEAGERSDSIRTNGDETVAGAHLLAGAAPYILSSPMYDSCGRTEDSFKAFTSLLARNI